MRHNYRIARAFRLNFQRLYFSTPVSCILSGGIGGLFTAGTLTKQQFGAATVDAGRALVSRETVTARCPVLRATVGPVLTCKGSRLLRWQPSSGYAVLCFFPLSDYSIPQSRLNVNSFFNQIIYCILMPNP